MSLEYPCAYKTKFRLMDFQLGVISLETMHIRMNS